jgi:redox-sensitive bicupin YhaK (pirin superfamily)
MSVTIETLPARRTELGSLKILRALPRSRRRMVGAWCFLDRYGPIRFTSEKPMDVAPHPHIGLQTVSWLVSGEIVHKDSLGCEALMRAGQLNLMTAGHGIAHSEETPKQHSGQLEGIQLWVALPDDRRQLRPLFDHYASLPVFTILSTTITVILGGMSGHESPARAFSPIIGADIGFNEKEVIDVPLAPHFEHAIFVLRGDAVLNGVPISADALHYLSPGREELSIAGSRGCRILFIGGEPFPEPILMWWNFVARSHEEMAQARQDWVEHQRFGEVKAYEGPRLPAPDLASLAAPNPAS